MVKRGTILSFGIVVCLMITSHYEYLPIFSLLFKYNSYICAFLCVVLWLLSKNQVAPYCGFINKFITMTYVIVIIECIYTVIYGNLTAIEVLQNSLFYLYLLLIYPLMFILMYINERKINCYIIVIAGLMMIYCAYVAFTFNSTGNVLNMHLIYNEDNLRNGAIRIGSIGTFWVVLLITFNGFLYENEMPMKIVYCILSIGSLLYLILINQSRAQGIAIVIMLFGMYLMKKRRSRLQILVCSIAMIAVIVVLSSEWFQSFIYSFSSEAVDNTTSIRLIIIAELNKYVKDMPLGYLFGHGIRDYIFINGRQRWFLDVGLLGDLLNTGVLAAIMFFGIVGRQIYVFKRLHNNNPYGFTFVLGAFLMVVCGIPGFSILPHSRFIAVPIIMAYTEFFYQFNRQELLEKDR